VLAVLLVHANRAVSGEQLALAVGRRGARGSEQTVRVHVSRLRKALGDGDALVTTAEG
jgi:DNA-binding response OmpR family regulator